MLGEAPTVGEDHVQSGYAEEFGEQNGEEPLGLSVFLSILKDCGHLVQKGWFTSGALLLFHFALRNDKAVVFVAVLQAHPEIVRNAQLLFQCHRHCGGETALALDKLVQMAGLDADCFGQLFLFDAALFQLLGKCFSGMHRPESCDSVIVVHSVIHQVL